MSFLAAPAIQSYVNGSYAEWSGAFRPGTNNIYGTGPADTQRYLSQFDFNTGVMLSYQDINALGTSCEFQGAFTLDPSGNVWCYNAGGGDHYPQVTQIVPRSPWALGAQWGTGSPPTGIPHNPTGSVWLTVGSATYLVFGTFASAGGDPWDVWVLRTDSLGFAGHEYNNTGGSTTVGAGPQSAASATAYWTCQPFSIYGSQFALGSTVIEASAASWLVEEWPTANPGIVSTTIKAYAPTDFDASWTSITSLSGPAYDQTDGNVIVQVQGAGGGNANYIAKLAVSNGAVLWKVAIAGSQGFDQHAIALSRIYFGTYYYWDGANCHAIDTATGVDTTQAYSVTLSINQQVSDDVLGCVLGNVTWSGAGLVLLNSTAASGGTMGAVYFTTGGSGGGGGGGGAGQPYDAMKRAWTFTLDGHTFYVLQLEAQGTWVYDTSTQQWAEWDTATYGLWNMINGCMWGYRIVAGSSQTTDVWELAPSLLLDEGVFNISHAATGIIDVRSRKYYSVASLSLTASAGILDETTGTTFSLRFSDDQGQTWSGYYTVSLFEGDFSEEIAWRSLGSFGRPGRVFELSDVGGPVRLDGADVFIDNFDEEDPPQGQQQ